MTKNLQSDKFIEVIGARVHNLQNIDVSIPRNSLVVITGLSGSGKSSLAFDTIYAEGQRRYIETFSAYARQFLGNLERPDVDKITGLSPVISIEQKTISRNPRSTVGTITEIYDFIRLLYARIADSFSYNTGEKMIRYTKEQIIDLIAKEYQGKKIMILAPVVKGRKGHYRELFQQILKMGFLRARVDGEIKDLSEKVELNRYQIHDIEIVIDRLDLDSLFDKRLAETVKVALKHGKGMLQVLDVDEDKARYFSQHLMCPSTGISYPEPEPNLFSFNSPYGYCKKCNGLGEISQADKKKIIPVMSKSIYGGGIIPLGSHKENWIFKQIAAILKKEGLKLKTPIKDIPEDTLSKILHGTNEHLKIETATGINQYSVNFEGVVNFVVRQAKESQTKSILKWANSFMDKVQCPDCKGSRLKDEALYFKINAKNISELANMDISELAVWFQDVHKHLNKKQLTIAREALKEINNKLSFLMDVGLNYLTLNRSAKTLSGGEAQRIRLATQIGSKLVGVLYILDEPSIGLHQRDNERLINSLKKLRDSGNSVIVVEHDKEIMFEADHILDIGPGAGVLGGKVVAEGNIKNITKNGSVTSAYLTGKDEITVPTERRKGNGKKLRLTGASGHNLRNVDVEFPLGKFICITGVSGSGKSSLINQTLYPLLNNYYFHADRPSLPHKKVKGLDHLDKVIEINQSPIGRTPRSNPATYTKVFSDIRNLYALLPEAKIRGYKAGRFSFNTAGGRCETCKGGGLRSIEMNFLPDVYVSCESCGGKRYNRETLEVRYKGKSIADVLDMDINEATEFFSEHPKISRILRTLQDVGLGYLSLGQQSTTLSGGEAQRVKLSSELSKIGTGNTFYILDEPTTGLHFHDIKQLISVLDRLVDNGNTVCVIEHNLDIVKVADHVIDLGPEGGNGGGHIVFAGTPEELAASGEGNTSAYLAKELDPQPSEA
ncbi:MAG: excinuclease ABC subunit UvrA [Flavobacteriales bacterium]|nr:excinuclease ABC subunit UvrA [Flavobacteriales bacterium]